MDDAKISERDYTSLRPSEAVRLINAAGFGRVLQDRQLFRHRQKCPQIESSSKRIDLYAYTAWLLDCRHQKARPKRRRSIDGNTVDLNFLRDLLEQQEYRCAISGDQLTPSNFALDHIVPLANEGSCTTENCQIVTKEINRAKNTMDQERFIAMCKRIAKNSHRIPNAKQTMLF